MEQYVTVRIKHFPSFNVRINLLLEQEHRHSMFVISKMELDFCEYFGFFPFFSEDTVKYRVSPASSTEERFSHHSLSSETRLFKHFLGSHIS